jgi:hypothetical protein
VFFLCSKGVVLVAYYNGKTWESQLSTANQQPTSKKPTTQKKPNPVTGITPTPPNTNAINPTAGIMAGLGVNQVVNNPTGSIKPGDQKKNDEVTGTNAANTGVGEPITVTNDTSIQDYITQIQEEKKNAAIAGFQKARDNSLSNLANEEAGIEPAYYDLKNQAGAQSDVQALNFANYMASKGIKGAAGGMPQMYRNSALQGVIGKYDAMKQADLDKIARERTGFQNAYESDVAAASSNIDAAGLQAYIDQMNADRTFNYQKSRDEVGDVQWGKTFDQNQAQIDAENEYRTASLEQAADQFQKQYGLDLRKMTLEEAAAKIDDLYKRGLIDQAAAQTANMRAATIKNKQTANTEEISPSDYKTSPEFADDVAAATADPEGFIGSLQSNPQAYIKAYGWDGYQALLKLVTGE